MIVSIIAYSGPIVVGLIIPLLISDKDLHLRTFLLRILILTSIVVLVIGLSVLLAQDSSYSLTVKRYIFLVLFLASWSVLIGGLHFFLSNLNTIKILAQIVMYAVVFFLCGWVFFANPLVEAFVFNPSIRQFFIKATVFGNPFLTMAASFFSHDILRSGELYKQSVIGAYYPYNYANWVILTCIYCIIGVICYFSGYRLRKSRVLI
ncbi:MAG: hypothetical protein WC980_05690 [Candidatus Brocadiia bacterium]